MLQIEAQLQHCLRKDRYLLQKQWLNLEKITDLVLREEKLLRWQEKLAISQEMFAKRQALVPSMTYPDLPIMAKKQEIIAALANHQVVIVAGETGSGKTTQLPKLCLEAGLGVSGYIGHTQPRRLAARAVASRIASELQSEVGHLVGFQVRFSDKTSPTSLIKLMTDGILLSQTQQDKWLQQYDCIIIDEAHERSLNIDFLLGYLKNLLQKRPDLKLIVTSATIDVERFATFFNHAPLICVEGRSYPVEVRYLAESALSERSDPVQSVLEAVTAAYQEGLGDILIFQSGEKEIREVCEALQAQNLPNTIILPLFSRLSVGEQQKIFQSMHKRKIIVATNVAETSITVPNIRFVIDEGLQRIKRYNFRNKLQRLPIEPISQASSEQRKGRCGRVGPGICFRLYTEEDLLTRDRYTEPEILRTNLAGVILKMLSLGWHSLERFPFLDVPDNRFIKDGYALLERLEAVSKQGTITPIGRQLAEIPIEPKLGRIIIGANQYGALKEILIIVSALSIVDPREYPIEFKEKATQSHAKFLQSNSDFMAFLTLWEFIHQQKSTLSNQKFRKLCRENFLSYLRICEWQDVHAQLQDVVKELHFKVNQLAAEPRQIHQALLTGFLDTIGQKEQKTEYLGARGVKFLLHPSSVLFKKPPLWVLACEIVHTSKTYARVNAEIDLKWIEEVARHLLKRQYVEPHLDIKEQKVVAFERATLFGLEIISRRKVNYEKIDPVEARRIFILQGLVEQQLTTRCLFYQKNNQTIAHLRKLEDRIRRQVTLVNEELIYAFYERHLPAGILSVRTLEQWAKQADERILIFSAADIGVDNDSAAWESLFPSTLSIADKSYSLRYQFDLAAEDDGVTMLVPVDALAKLQEQDFSWLIPGLLTEKIASYLKALPKRLRVLLNPLPETIKQATLALNSQLPFEKALRTYLAEIKGLALGQDIWQHLVIPAHLKMHFTVLGPQNEILATGDDLPLLYDKLRGKFTDPNTLQSPFAHQGQTTWDFGDIPTRHIEQKNQLQLIYYPALTDNKENVKLALYETPILAQDYHRLGLARLYLLTLKDSAAFIKKQMQAQKKVIQQYPHPFGDFTVLTEQLLLSVAAHTFTDITVRSKAAFEEQLQKYRQELIGKANTLISALKEWLALHQQIERLRYRLADKASKEMQVVLSDVDNQLLNLFEQHFMRQTPWLVLMRYTIYLKGIVVRLENLPRLLARDKESMESLRKVQKAYESKLASKKQVVYAWDDPLLLFRYKIEELRISLFAQKLGTQETVSAVRLLKLLENLG